MTIDEIRSYCIRALASDPYLFDQLVLKGGNALALIHGIGNRSSVDLDYSLEGDVVDQTILRDKLKSALDVEFDKHDLIVVGERFESRPRTGTNPLRFGGYRFEFMLSPREAFTATPKDIHALARSAVLSGPNQQRKFRIEISRYEFCDWKEQAQIDDVSVYVYSPEMIVAEKLRALCQQMPEYQHRTAKTPRPRDFYDIYACVLHAGVNMNTPHFAELLRNIFEVKSVPLVFLERIESFRSFHATGWESVEVAVAENLDEYDFYFDLLSMK